MALISTANAAAINGTEDLSGVFLKMEGIFMNQNQFEMITRNMQKRYGKIRNGDEEIHSMMLFPMESNLLKVYRKHQEANSRRLKEAILLALYQVSDRLTGAKTDVGKFESSENLLLRDALLSAFDPFANEEIAAVLQEEGQLDLNDRDVLEKYYKEPVLCLLRIRDSVEHWEKRGGSNGYFEFLNEWLGGKVPDDGKMNFSIYAGMAGD